MGSAAQEGKEGSSEDKIWFRSVFFECRNELRKDANPSVDSIRYTRMSSGSMCFDLEVDEALLGDGDCEERLIESIENSRDSFVDDESDSISTVSLFKGSSEYRCRPLSTNLFVEP